MGLTIRRARTSDIPAIRDIAAPLVERRILLGKEWVESYGAVPEFRVAIDDGRLVGFGALHVIWADLGEVRTLAVHDDWRGRGVGHRLLGALEDDAREYGLNRLFCLTFEVDFFARHGFAAMGAETVDPATYAELVRSSDEGIAEFLDLARVKPNTLGNARMIKHL